MPLDRCPLPGQISRLAGFQAQPGMWDAGKKGPVPAFMPAESSMDWSLVGVCNLVSNAGLGFLIGEETL